MHCNALDANNVYNLAADGTIPSLPEVMGVHSAAACGLFGKTSLALVLISLFVRSLRRNCTSNAVARQPRLLPCFAAISIMLEVLLRKSK